MESEINLTVLHLSDLHFGKYNTFKGEKSLFIDCCDTMIKVINNFYKENRIPKAELLLISGDIGSSGDEDDYIQGHPELNASYFLKTYFNEYIPNNLIVVPGNHDLKWAGREGATKKYKFREYYSFLKKIGVINQIPEYYERPHFYKSYQTLKTIVLGLNSCMFTSYSGDTIKAKHYEKYQHRSLFNEDKLFDILLKIKKKHPEGQFRNPYFRIAIMHHNIYPFKGNSIKIFNTKREIEKNEIKFLNKLHFSYEYDIFIHGHRHENFILPIDNSLIIGGGSLLVEPKKRMMKWGDFNKQIRKNSFNIISLKKKLK